MQVRRVLTAGSDNPNLVAVAEQVDELLQIVDDKIEFGEPQNPHDPTDTSQLAGAMGAENAHNGTVSNIAGSWVEISLTATGLTTETCVHNLYLQDPDYVVPVTGEPNCRWLPFGLMHDGQGQDATSGLSLDITFLGDTVAANSIQLRVNLSTIGTAVTVDGDHPALITLFFTRATRGE